MRRLPLAFVERIFRLPFMQRPRLLVHTSHKSPSAEELPPNLMIIEIRSGYLKWVHLLCPKRGDHIQLPLAGAERCSISVDLLRRPTLAPSIAPPLHKMLEQVSGAGASIRRLALAGSYGTSWTAMVDAGTEPSFRMMCRWPLPGSTSVGAGCPGTNVYT